MKITDKNFVEETKKQVEPLMQELVNGKSARDIAKDIYLTLPDKTEEIAYMMVDNMTEIIENYHDEFDTCYANEESYIIDKLQDSTKGIDDAVERCKVYHRILVSLAAQAIYTEGGEDAEARAKAYVDEHKEFECTSEEAVEKETELFNLTVEALKKADVLTMQLPVVLEQIQNEDFDAASGSFALGRESSDLKLILAMQAYVNAQNGMYEDISEEASMEQIVYNVCGAADTCAVAAQAEEGTVEESTAIKILRVIGKILGIAALMYLALKAMFYLGFVLWKFFPLSLFMSVVLATVVILTVIKKFSMDEGAKQLGSALLVGASYLVGYAAGAVVKGVKKLIEWAKPYVTAALLWIKDTVCSLLTRLSNAIGNHAKEQNAETISNSVTAEESENEADEEEEEGQAERNTVFA